MHIKLCTTYGEFIYIWNNNIQNIINTYAVRNNNCSITSFIRQDRIKLVSYRVQLRGPQYIFIYLIYFTNLFQYFFTFSADNCVKIQRAISPPIRHCMWNDFFRHSKMWADSQCLKNTYNIHRTYSLSYLLSSRIIEIVTNSQIIRCMWCSVSENS